MTTDASCFVIMPYRVKKDADGRDVDFDEIYEYVIKRAVKRVPGLACVRCDDFDQPGWIPARMLTQILEARVAVVDLSTLNPNVFYELGVRHALRPSVTVLIRRRGTTQPFNIEGMATIEYDSTTPKGIEDAKRDIRGAIVSALGDEANVDSLVYQALPGLRVQRGPARAPKRVTRLQVIEFPLANAAERALGIVTGDRDDIKVGDVWVNSENTNMQMDRFFGASTSATIRYLGARKSLAGVVEEDPIEAELRAKMAAIGASEVAPCGVLATGAGALRENNGVKWIFHVAAVKGEPREGYRPVGNIERCVTNVLREAGRPEYGDEVRSVLLPILGTGPGGGEVRDHARRCFQAAIEFMETHPAHPTRTVYFYVWTDVDLETCRGIVRELPLLKPSCDVV
jgi:O-acetyl-ADP-ribose deacetylase (regulator of RNase III)